MKPFQGGRRPLTNGAKFILGLAVVAASLAALFTLPSKYFVPSTFVATSCMLAASYVMGVRPGLNRAGRQIAIGLVSATTLYLVFLLGNEGIKALQPFGVGTSSENAIYSLIASPANPLPLQVAVLAFDSAGYEAYFRGVLQRRLQMRLGLAAAPAVAGVDAAIHALALFQVGPATAALWVGTTFVADMAWGLTYRYSRGLGGSLTSHFVWDVMVFVILPIR